jgi:hypothetical protein
MTVEPPYETVALPYLAFEAVALDNASHPERVFVAGRLNRFSTHNAVHAVQAVHTIRNHQSPRTQAVRPAHGSSSLTTAAASLRRRIF